MKSEILEHLFFRRVHDHCIIHACLHIYIYIDLTPSMLILIDDLTRWISGFTWGRWDNIYIYPLKYTPFILSKNINWLLNLRLRFSVVNIKGKTCFLLWVLFCLATQKIQICSISFVVVIVHHLRLKEMWWDVVHEKRRFEILWVNYSQCSNVQKG